VIASVSISGDPNFAPVTIDGSAAGSATGLRLAGADSSLDGVTIRRFGLWGLRVDADRIGVSNVEITENHLTGVLFSASSGTLTGSFVAGNLGAGVEFAGNGNRMTKTIVGGTNSAGGVILSGNSNVLASVFNGIGGNQIFQNSGFGLLVSGSDNSVTDTTVSSNLGPGILVSGNRNQIGALIGFAAYGVNLVDGNQGSGIEVAGGDQNSLWANHVGLSALNGGAAVFVHSGATRTTVVQCDLHYGAGIGVRVGTDLVDAATTRTDIGTNSFTGSGMWIDLAGDGPTANDPCDADTGPNELQNWPIVTAASEAGFVTLTATLNSKPLQTFTVFFYSIVSSGKSEYLGLLLLSTDAACNAGGVAIFPVSNPLDRLYLATATSTAGSTSEFSPAVAATPPPPRSFYTLAPCRVVDTRGPIGPLGGPDLVAFGTRQFPLAGACAIPATAKALSINVTVTHSGDSGDLRIYPAGAALPLTSTINYRVGQTRANNAIVTLGPAGDLSVFCEQPLGGVDLIIDVNGYFQ